MNQEWSELNKAMQKQLGNRKSFDEGISTLIVLRQILMEQMIELQDTLSGEQMCAIPYINAKGYHNKTIAYSLYHIFRIEDIVAHTIIAGDEEIFFSKDYKQRLNTSIITTGNELVKQEIAEFSRELNLKELSAYARDVDDSTRNLLLAFTYDDMKRTFTDEEKAAVRAKRVVSDSEAASWLVDYWCDKDVRGLIKMPFSRHWIMHLEACLRIKSKVQK